ESGFQYGDGWHDKCTYASSKQGVQSLITRRPVFSEVFEDHWLYLRKLLRQGASVASAMPSSRWVARGMLRGIQFQRTSVIVELGAGTGPITAEILRAATNQCRCLIVECDPDFCRRLRSRFPTAEIIEADALDYRHILNERRI